jgi:cyanophycinase
MPVGGAEDKSTDEPILRRFFDLAGDDDARVAIVPTASTEPDAGEIYLSLFRAMGVKQAEILRVRGREDANREAALEPLRDATGIYISGGNQARLVALMAGTLAMECIRERQAAGAVLAGTSAGASILGSHMMAGGLGAEVPRKGMTEMVAGFGLLQDMIIDQHFTQRGRIGRLLVLYAANPGLLSLGIDEDTAAVIDADGTMEVIGSNSITILDGRSVVSNYYQIEEGEAVTVTGSSLHLLGPGQRFDLRHRRVVGLDAA